MKHGNDKLNAVFDFTVPQQLDTRPQNIAPYQKTPEMVHLMAFGTGVVWYGLQENNCNPADNYTGVQNIIQCLYFVSIQEWKALRP